MKDKLANPQPSPAGPVIDVRDLHKVFGTTVAIKKISFTVAPGEILGFLGPNGAGKTTAIAILLGLITPTSGTVHIFGQELEANRVKILQRSNFSSAYVSLPTNLKVIENLRVFARLYEVKQAEQTIAALMNQMEVTHLRDRITGQLSAGESTRVNLCKAFLNDPRLLLLDEPTASLDPDMADKVRKLLRQMQRERGLSMLYTSHNMRDVEEVCDRVLFMRQGSIIAEGTPQDILKQFKEASLEEVFIRVARDGAVEEVGA
jgi:ABC-2 type transport system ATP-binding protein